MQSETPYKICPQCQTPTGLTTPICARCGRQFRTQYPTPRASATLPPSAHVSAGTRVLIASCVLVLLLGCAVVAKHQLPGFSLSAVPALYRGPLVLCMTPYATLSGGNDQIAVASRDPNDLTRFYHTFGGSIMTQHSIEPLHGNDTRAQDELLESGRIVLVEPFTGCEAVEIMSTDTALANFARIRITGGIHDGQTGFVSRNFLGRRDASGRFIAIEPNGNALF